MVGMALCFVLVVLHVKMTQGFVERVLKNHLGFCHFSFLIAMSLVISQIGAAFSVWIADNIARRDKKAFLSDQCKEIEENNRMGKTRDLFKKIIDTKGKFPAKMGTIKDRNGMDLTEADDIKRRWKEYTEELCKKDLHDPDNYNSVITHVDPDILECKVK